MKKHFVALALASVLAAQVPCAAKNKETKDPVLMTVGDMQVPLSEFTYLYNKNKAQQHDTLTVEEYLPLFIDYKLKVADAINCKVDTASAFRKEFNGYRMDLFRPYLEDKATLDSLVNDAYSHATDEVCVSHIMFPKGSTPEEQARNYALADSFRTAIIEGRADFVETARKYSMDQSVSQNNGSTGYFTGGRFPYSFESAAYNTPVGGFAPIVDTKFGWHIVRVDGRRKSPGEVHVRHILKLTQGKQEAELPKIENNIHNVYQLLLAGSDFAELASKISEDPGSARNGGELPWFGRGQMVPEFEKVSYELADSAISVPFKTNYGWHIVQKLGHRDVAPLDDLRPALIAGMSRDERANMPRDAKFRQLRTRFGASAKEQNLSTLTMAIERAGRLDSALLAIFTQNPMVFAVVNGKEYTCAEVLSDIDLTTPLATSVAVATVTDLTNRFIDDKVVDLEVDRLEREDKDFANLLHEYRDGMLMFEQSNRQVWEAAANDPAALEQYFEANKGKYRFDSPKFKGIVILTASDSVSQAAKDYIKANNLGLDSLAQQLRKNVDKVIRVEKVLVEKGKNKAVDEEIFGVEKTPGKESSRYKSHFIYDGKLIDAPEEISDIRAQLVTDYQESLNSAWVKQLKKKYPVKVNKKVLKQVK